MREVERLAVEIPSSTNFRTAIVRSNQSIRVKDLPANDSLCMEKSVESVIVDSFRSTMVHA